MPKSKQLITIVTVVSLLSLFPRAFATARVPEPDTNKSESCTLCQAQPEGNTLTRLDRLSTLGRRTQAIPFRSIKRSMFDGLSVNFVNTSRGNLALGIVDVYAPGSATIAFQRSYVSDRTEDMGLGIGWSFSFSDRITIRGDVAELSDVNGTLKFRRDQSGRFVLQPAEAGEHQQFEITDPSTITERVSDLTRVFTKIGDAYRLSRITGPQGINVFVSHDAAGKLTRVQNETGGWIALEWSKDRLLGVVDSSGRHISFRQDGRMLRTVIDPLGAKWNYAYTSQKLRQAIDPVGRVLLRARYDKAGRIAAVGDAFGLSHYNYELRRTTVTGPLGAVTVYEQTDLGSLAAITGNGSRVSMRYNDANRLIKLSDSSGHEMTFNYDSENRLLNQRGEILSINSNCPNDDQSGTGRFTRDTAGRVTAAHFPSGLSVFNEYDGRGDFARQSDNSGNVIRVKRDASGLPVEYVRADGRRRQAIRDEGGRVIRDINYDGSVRSFTYDVRGALIEYKAPGNHRKFEYDRRGQLKAIVEDNGTVGRVERDELGRILRLNYSADVGRRLAHAPQDIMPPPDCCGDAVIYTDVWARYQNWEIVNGWMGSGDGMMIELPPPGNGQPGGGGGPRPDPVDCAMWVTACFMGIMLYPHFVAALMGACAETFGLGCFVALVYMIGEPLLAILACAQAYNKCRPLM